MLRLAHKLEADTSPKVAVIVQHAAVARRILDGRDHARKPTRLPKPGRFAARGQMARLAATTHGRLPVKVVGHDLNDLGPRFGRLARGRWLRRSRRGATVFLRGRGGLRHAGLVCSGPAALALAQPNHVRTAAHLGPRAWRGDHGTIWGQRARPSWLWTRTFGPSDE